MAPGVEDGSAATPAKLEVAGNLAAGVGAGACVGAEARCPKAAAQVWAATGCAAAAQGVSPAYLVREALCGVTVALAMVPEAVAFSLAAGLKPKVGLVSSFFICLITSLFGGRPAMVSGATGSIAVLVGPIIQTHGVEYLFYAVMLMGLFQIVLGLLGVGNLGRLVPVPVEIGFCNGLALVIGFAQLTSFKVPSADHARRLSEVPEAFHPFTDGEPWVSGDEAIFAAIITVVAFLVSVLLPRLTERVPSALCSIAIGTAIEWGIVRAVFHSQTTIIGDLGSAGGSFPAPVWFDSSYTMPPPTSTTLGKVYSLAVIMAAIGLLESVMTLSLVNELTKTKSSIVRECVGQGVANIVCGAFGGMGGCAMLGQSMINVSSGARGRLSTFICSLFILFIVLVAYPAINILPVSALAGVMFNVVYHTFEWSSLKLMAVALLPKSFRDRFLRAEGSRWKKIRRADALVILVVTVVTLLSDLAVAVACGVAMSCLLYVYDSAEFISVTSRMDTDTEDRARTKIYNVHGVLFFGSASRFLELFDAENDPEEVQLIFESSYVSDYSAIEALNKLGERYAGLGKRVTLQLLHPGNSRIVEKAKNLLVKELTLEMGGGRVLDEASGRRNIEGYGTTQSFLAREGGAAAVPLLAEEASGSLHLRVAAAGAAGVTAAPALPVAAPSSEEPC